MRSQKEHTNAPDNAWDDIVQDFSAFLTELFVIGDVLKVPGRKAKSKLRC